MPVLTWPGKSLPEPSPASLLDEACIFPQGLDYPTRPANRLILGDNLTTMMALLPELEGRINLIYADPPFFTRQAFKARIGRGEDSRKPNDWQLAEGYSDTWDDLDSYLDFLYPRLAMMHRLLSPTGTLYLHLDWHANSYARLLLDEIFGADQLLNEIIWAYHGPSPIRTAFNRKHDTLLAYTKGKQYTFNSAAVREPYNPSTIKTFGASSKAGFGKVPDLKRGKVPEDWWYFPVIARLHSERTGYPTQKPEALLERIILASSNAGDLVADFFCGAGTAPLVAARHGRRFVAVDSMWRAVHTTRARLVRAGDQAFMIQRTPESQWAMKSGRKSALHQDAAQGVVSLTAPENLDYWELDPAWDGSIFNSMAQAGRPVRAGHIPDMLHVPQTKSGRRLCVRMVMNSGEQVQIEL